MLDVVVLLTIGWHWCYCSCLDGKGCGDGWLRQHYGSIMVVIKIVVAVVLIVVLAAAVAVVNMLMVVVLMPVVPSWLYW